MKIYRTLSISVLALCGLPLGLAISSPADTLKSGPVLQADGGMPAPPVKKPGGTRMPSISLPATSQIADGGMPAPPVKKPGGRRTPSISIPATLQIADGGMPAPPVKKPGGKLSA